MAAIFGKPTSASIVFSDIEALIKALGGSVHEREGCWNKRESNREHDELSGRHGAELRREFVAATEAQSMEERLNQWATEALERAVQVNG